MRTPAPRTRDIVTHLVALTIALSAVGCSSCGGSSSTSPDATATAAVEEGSADLPAAADVPGAEAEAEALHLSGIERATHSALQVGTMIEPAPRIIQTRIREFQFVPEEMSAEQIVRECELLVPDTCLRAGALAMDGTPEGVATLVDRWASGCAGGEEGLCDALASFLVSVDATARVQAALGPACDEGATAACRAIAWANLGDLTAAQREELDAACTGGDGRSCRMSGTWFADHDELALAGAMFRRGCDQGDRPACLGAIASSIAAGTELDDLERASLGELCDLNMPEACALAGHVARRPDMEDAALYAEVITPWRSACTEGAAASCYDIAQVVLARAPRPDAEAIASGEGDAVAAWQATVDEATPWLVTSCNLGIGDACWQMVEILNLRELGERELLLDAELRRRACDAGVAEACAALTVPAFFAVEGSGDAAPAEGSGAPE